MAGRPEGHGTSLPLHALPRNWPWASTNDGLNLINDMMGITLAGRRNLVDDCIGYRFLRLKPFMLFQDRKCGNSFPLHFA